MARRRQTAQVLSIDFDFWVPDPLELDMGHREAKFFIDAMWGLRAGQALARGVDLREVMKVESSNGLLPSTLLSALKGHLASPQKLKIAIAESHASLYYFLEGETDIEMVNLDAHHDCGYQIAADKLPDCEVDCGNWAGKLVMEGRVKKHIQVFPTWKRDSDKYGGEAWEFMKGGHPLASKARCLIGWKPSVLEGFKFTHVFLCRSGAWVPPWADPAFTTLAMCLSHQGSASMYTFKTFADMVRVLKWKYVEAKAKMYKQLHEGLK